MIRDEALTLADRILGLVNSMPRTPTRDELANEIAKAGADALPDDLQAEVNAIWNARVVDDQTDCVAASMATLETLCICSDACMDCDRRKP